MYEWMCYIVKWKTVNNKKFISNHNNSDFLEYKYMSNEIFWKGSMEFGEVLRNDRKDQQSR